MRRALFVLALALADCAVAQVDWNTPQEPVRVFGNTYYVGTTGLTAVLITSDGGHILIDGGLPQSAPLIEANIRAVGFTPRDVRLILNSHEHYDHAGGIATLQRASGGRVAASPAAARALMQGHPVRDDPQYRSGLEERYPPVKTVETISDGTTLKVGSLAVTAHFTPGHTPGATSWSWRSCEDGRCVAIVYSDSLTAVSDDEFRFSGDASHPSIVDQFRASIARVEELPCDIVLAPHPAFINFADKAKRSKLRPDADPYVNPFIERSPCRAFAATARKRLEQRLADETKR